MIAIAGVLALATAHAQPCAAPATIDRVLADLIAVETAVRLEDPAALEASRTLEQDMACSDEVLPWIIRARLLRAVGAPRSITERGPWWSAARQIDPTWRYGAADGPSALREAWEAHLDVPFEHVPLAAALVVRPPPPERRPTRPPRERRRRDDQLDRPPR